MGGGAGVGISRGSSARVINNVILDSTIVGIFINTSSYGEIRGNTMDSSSGNFSQIFTTGSSSADVFNNTITASSGGGIDAVFASSVEAGDNNVSGTVSGGITVAQNAHMFLRSENTVNNPDGQAIFCGFTGSLRVDQIQMITAGTVFVDPGCEIDNVAGDPSFPP